MNKNNGVKQKGHIKGLQHRVDIGLKNTQKDTEFIQTSEEVYKMHIKQNIFVTLLASKN